MRFRLWRRRTLPAEQRKALERWVRLRVQMLDGDPTDAVARTVARLTGEGMGHKQATEMVARILREEEDRGPSEADVRDS